MPRSSSTSSALLLIIAVILLAMNLRAPIIAVGPLTTFIQQDLNINGTIMGIIAALPVLSFAIFSPFAAGLGRRFGIEEVLISAIIVLICGILIRSVGASFWFLLFGTIILSIGISMANVLLPSIIKRSLPHLLGRVTAFYSITMGIVAALAAVVVIPIAHHYNWEMALGVWILPAATALGVWIYVRFHYGHISEVKAANVVKINVWRSPLAWMISLMMGLQSLLYYTFSTWLPRILVSKGIESDHTGYYLLALQLASIPAIFLTTTLVTRTKKEYQQWLALCFCGINFIGTLLIWLLSTGLIFWVAMIGFGVSAVFTLCLLFFVMRTDSPIEAASLSGMAQSVGYLVAAVGPIGTGFLYDLTQSWNAPLMVICALMAFKTYLGWRCGRPVTLRQAKLASLHQRGNDNG